ncbi:hypothetical protein [Aquibacillus rhizosphaerae]|uniref:Uncharacterized protein n=1 Tax=Aquibacillus rhizosphaerae TaxID=3051431 RepID=A0ABT7L095_9BACI|nr:hypothetical protein [Aquibacillus sp. LR5S19]MDL4839244.1 hypothetical protein [Aquibacillus sp. LR5S19]
MTNDEIDYDSIYRKLDQHEQTISQLVAIIAVNNRKINELNRKQISLEQLAQSSYRSLHVNPAKQAPLVSMNTPQK